MARAEELFVFITKDNLAVIGRSILPTVGREGHFGEVTTDGRRGVYLGEEDRHEHAVWFSSAERYGDCCLGLTTHSPI